MGSRGRDGPSAGKGLCRADKRRIEQANKAIVVSLHRRATAVRRYIYRMPVISNIVRIANVFVFADTAHAINQLFPIREPRIPQIDAP